MSKTKPKIEKVSEYRGGQGDSATANPSQETLSARTKILLEDVKTLIMMYLDCSTGTEQVIFQLSKVFLLHLWDQVPK